jgi:hypothetical protein
MYTLETTIDGKTQCQTLEVIPTSIVMRLYAIVPAERTLVAEKVVL